MRKQAILFGAALLAAGLLAGCSRTDKNNSGTGTSNTGDTTSGAESQTNGGNPASGTRQLGLGVISRLDKAENAGEKDGSLQVNTIIAAVTLDGDGRIADCRLDMVQSDVTVSNTGAIGSPSRTEYSTKKELGSDYGMQKVSQIGKEWYEQAEAFEKYAAGKTVSEINGIATDDKGYATEESLHASVSISVTEFQAAITKAAENASAGIK